MAIHATDLLYDIALPLSCYSFVLSFSLSPSSRSLLSALLALTLIPLRSFIFAIMASCIFFSSRHRGVRKYTLSRAPYGDYNRIADSSAINPSRLRAHPPPPSRRYWISREDPSTNYLFNALESRLLPYCDFHLDIEAVARPRFSRSLARSQVSRHFEPRDLDD